MIAPHSGVRRSRTVAVRFPGPILTAFDAVMLAVAFAMVVVAMGSHGG